MKNITFSAADDLIAQARELARARGATLNDEFRIWLTDYVQQQGQGDKTARMRLLIDQITSPKGQPGGNVPASFAYTPEHQRQPVRDAFNEREQRMLKRLGE